MRGRISMFLLIGSAVLLIAGTAAAEGHKYGKGVSKEDTVLVSHLLSHTDDYVGKVVRVAGTAVGTCPHRGCWLNLASDKEGEVVRVQVPDGVIVFPPEIVGDYVIAEGVFTANKLDLETTRKVCAYNAQEAGEEFDPTDINACMTLFHVEATGAVAHEKVGLEAGAVEASTDAKAAVKCEHAEHEKHADEHMEKHDEHDHQ